MALAIATRSPKSWVSSLMYGVSPQPAQAPENSKSGRQSWAPLTVARFSFERSYSGRSRKNLKFSASASRSGICSVILIAPLAFIGQACTQAPQPVQSSGATWRVNFLPSNSFVFASVDLNVAGAPSSLSAS